MKKTLIVVILALFLFSAVACTQNNDASADCVRIHIRANSNTDADQVVKLAVRDAVVKYLTPLLANCADKESAKKVVVLSIPALTAVANDCLISNSFPYTAEIALTREEFPYRRYMDYSFPAGVYDALIVNLGNAQGDNWWCVCFPPLCFIPDGDDEDTLRYKSKIIEIIEKYRGKYD